MRPGVLLQHFGGVARADQLLLHTSHTALRTAVARGEITRLRRGSYALPSALAADAAAARLSGSVSHLSAAVAHGWEVLRQPDRPWVTVPRNRKITPLDRRGVHVVYGSVDAAVTSPLRTVIDCARRLPFAEALAVADSAVRHRVVDLDELYAAGMACRGPGASGCHRVAKEASMRSANPFESALRAIALDVQGLDPRPQVPLDLGPFVVHSDLYDHRLRLVIEAEGWLYHGSPEAFASDLERYTLMTAFGLCVARFGHRDVTRREEWVAGVLRDLVGLCEQRVSSNVQRAG